MLPCLPTRRISTFLELLPPDPVRSPALLSLTAQGQVRYTLKMPYRDGSTHVAFESLDFIAGLAAVVPAGRVQSGQSGQKPGFARLVTWASLLPMDYLYSLYDALLSIHVPNDKARAVVDAMERVKDERGFDLYLMMLTDIINEGSEVLFVGNRSELVERAFDVDARGKSVVLPGVISRKKQVIPRIIRAINSL